MQPCKILNEGQVADLRSSTCRKECCRIGNPWKTFPTGYLAGRVVYTAYLLHIFCIYCHYDFMEYTRSILNRYVELPNRPRTH